MKKQHYVALNLDLLHVGIFCAIALLIGGCHRAQPPKAPVVDNVVVKVDENPVPGTVRHLWAEPMYDTVRVPGQLDPTGTYYRLPHNTVLEIRQKKYQRVEYPEDTKQSPVLLPPPSMRKGR